MAGGTAGAAAEILPADPSLTGVFGQSKGVELVWMVVACQIVPWLLLVNWKGFPGAFAPMTCCANGISRIECFFLKCLTEESKRHFLAV